MPFMDRLGGLFGRPQSYGGLLSEDDQKAAQQQAMLAASAQLMSSGGWSPQRTTLGQALGPALMAGQQAQQQAGNGMLEAMLLKTKLQPKKGKLQEDYEYAKSQGFTGTLEEWKRVASAQPSEAAAIQVHKYFEALTPEQRERFLQTQRSPVTDRMVTIDGVPTWSNPITHQNTPMSTVESEAEALRKKNEAEARGKAEGEAWGAMAKKGINALSVMESLDLAEPLIEVATGSTSGAAVDKVASFFGKSLPGDQAIGQLKILQANLMTNMPRMEGPQSDRDVQLYREAAGELGDPNVPKDRKKANLTMIRALQQRYASASPASSGQAPKKRFNPQTGKIE